MQTVLIFGIRAISFLFCFFVFFLSFLSFSASHSLSIFRSFLSFRLVVFRLILVSPSSLLLSLPCFPWWRILLFCYSVISSRRDTPPRAPCESEKCVFPLRAVYFLALLMLTYQESLFFFFSSFPFSISIWTSFVFHPVFFSWVLCCLLGFGFCCDSFSI